MLTVLFSFQALLVTKLELTTLNLGPLTKGLRSLAIKVSDP